MGVGVAVGVGVEVAATVRVRVGVGLGTVGVGVGVKSNPEVSATLARLPEGLEKILIAPVAVSVTVIVYCTSERAP